VIFQYASVPSTQVTHAPPRRTSPTSSTVAETCPSRPTQRPCDTSVLGAFRRQQAALSLKDGDAAVPIAAHRILFDAARRREGAHLEV
jgi:hypothetical protein